jgi:hypothetical protein
MTGFQNVWCSPDLTEDTFRARWLATTGFSGHARGEEAAKAFITL